MNAAGTRARAEALGERVAEARRRGLDPEERRRVMDAVALRTGDGWSTDFAVMMGMSVIVAVMGLSLDSAAVVIGAMLLAPLMSPVMGIAAAIAMALPRHLARSLVVVTLASVLSVLGAFVFATVLPDGLPDEVLSRTRPDLRDLMVALAAGAAGAYATVRADVSSSLPGVAVAVALVPPLAAIGVTLEAGRGDLAQGAILLYVANLTAIVLIGVLVFLLLGFVPPRRLRETSLRVVGGGLLVATATVVVAIPLTLASLGAAADGQDRERLQAAAEGWLQTTGDDLDEVRVDGDVVRIRVAGPTPPPDTVELERAAREILGPSATLEVRWTQTQAPPAEMPEATVDPSVADAEQRQAAVAGVVDVWLAGAGSAFDVERLEVTDDEIRIDLTSTGPPPPVDELSTRLADELGLSIPVVVNWTQRTTLRPGDDEADDVGSTLETLERRVELAATDWALDQRRIAVEAVDYDGEEVVIDLVGPDPGDVASLEAAVRALVGDDVTVTIWFTRRVRVVPDPPTSAPPGTTASPTTTSTPPSTTTSSPATSTSAPAGG